MDYPPGLKHFTSHFSNTNKADNHIFPRLLMQLEFYELLTPLNIPPPRIQALPDYKLPPFTNKNFLPITCNVCNPF